MVDDDDAIRRALSRLLRASDFNVITFASGQAFIDSLGGQRPGCVVMDFQMPGLNGIETARRMSEIAPAVPIVLFTQHASSDLEKHAREVGIRSVVSKTNAFPMVGMIEALLGPTDSEPAAADLEGSEKRQAE